MVSDLSSKSKQPVSDKKKPVLKRVKKEMKILLGLKKPRLPYQVDRAEGTDKRWEIILSNIRSGDRNLLDLGCNLGLLARRAADAGLLTLGVDVDAKLIRKARSRHRHIPNLSFMYLELNPETIKDLPEFDITLCLSVHHYWARHYGLEKSWEMMSTLLAKTRRRLFFEPASIRKKYWDNAPKIVDLDRQSIINYNMARLTALANNGETVHHLGETPCLGREPFRLLFVVERR
jgi:SAM-dependent methyltransferase